jgi:hypothetical protein
MSTPEPLTDTDVKTYATLAYAGTLLFALAYFPVMWAPALGLYLVFRKREEHTLLRGHLAQATSMSAVLAGYALVVRYLLTAAELDDRVLQLFPLVVTLVAAYPCVRAVQAALRLRPYTHPRPLAWLPLD